MSKAEKRALEAYPIIKETLKATTADGEYCEVDVNKQSRNIYLKGYLQAEKDLELSWKDMRDICGLIYNLRFHHKNQKEFFEEVLKRFLEQKGGKV